MQRVRRTPPAPIRVPRSPRSSSISVTIDVTAQVTSGAMDADALQEWVEEAIARYHTFRAGWVGKEMVASIKLPIVTVCDE